jgi:integrase
MPKLSLTQSNIKNIPAPERETWYADTEVSGLALRVTPVTRPTFFIKKMHERQMVKRSLGTVDEITPAEARRRARVFFENFHAKGINVFEQRDEARAELTFSEFWETVYIPHAKNESGRGGAGLKTASLATVQSSYRKHLKHRFGDRRLSDIKPADIRTLKRDMADTQTQFNRTRAHLSAAINLAITTENDDGTMYRRDSLNPCRSVKPYPKKKRTRALDEHERRRFLDAVNRWIADPLTFFDDRVFALYAKASYFIAPRKSELLTAEWAWINWNQCVIALPDSKTGARNLFLSQGAMAVLREARDIVPEDCPYVFPGKPIGRTREGAVEYRPRNNVYKAWTRLCAEAELEDFRPHDLRHTWATLAITEGGLTLSEVGAHLGHGHATTTELYAHLVVSHAVTVAGKMDAFLKG